MGEGHEDETVEFEDCVVKAVTEKALLVTVHGDMSIWIPKSQIDDDSEIYWNSESDYSKEGTLIIPRWLAEKAELV